MCVVHAVYNVHLFITMDEASCPVMQKIIMDILLMLDAIDSLFSLTLTVSSLVSIWASFLSLLPSSCTDALICSAFLIANSDSEAESDLCSMGLSVYRIAVYFRRWKFL